MYLISTRVHRVVNKKYVRMECSNVGNVKIFEKVNNILSMTYCQQIGIISKYLSLIDHFHVTELHSKYYLSIKMTKWKQQAYLLVCFDFFLILTSEISRHI